MIHKHRPGRACTRDGDGLNVLEPAPDTDEPSEGVDGTVPRGTHMKQSVVMRRVRALSFLAMLVASVRPEGARVQLGYRGGPLEKRRVRFPGRHSGVVRNRWAAVHHVHGGRRSRCRRHVRDPGRAAASAGSLAAPGLRAATLKQKPSHSWRACRRHCRAQWWLTLRRMSGQNSLSTVCAVSYATSNSHVLRVARTLRSPAAW